MNTTMSVFQSHVYPHAEEHRTWQGSRFSLCRSHRAGWWTLKSPCEESQRTLTKAGASRIPWSVNQGQTEDFPFYSYWDLQSGIHENWTMERDRKIKCNWSMKAAELHCQRFHFKNTWFRQHSNQQPSTHFRHNFQGLGMRLKPPLGRH